MSREGEWYQTAPHRLERQLKGFELIINLLEHHQDGNCQLVCGASIQSNLSQVALEERVEAAWLKTRQEIPMIGVALLGSQLSQATFEALVTPTAAQDWLHNTCHTVSDGTSFEELHHRRTMIPLDDQSGKLPEVHVVTRPRTGLRGFVIHSSHVLNGHFILRIMDSFGRHLVEVGSVRSFADVFQPEEIGSVQVRLPISTSYAYKQKFGQPTEEELAQVLLEQSTAAERGNKKSVGLPVRSDWRQQKSFMHSYGARIDPIQLAVLKQNLKAEGLTMTTAFFACITAAAARASEEAHTSPEGAHLLFSLHTKRWLKPGEGNGAVASMGVVPASVWLDGSSQDKQKALRARSREELVVLAREIQHQQTSEISSVHVLKCLDDSADALYQATDCGRSPLPTTFPSVSKPTLTSQGLIDLGHHFGDTTKKDTWLDFETYAYGGRHTDPSLCFALYLFRGELHVATLWDERYFESQRVHNFIETVLSLFEKLIVAPSASAASVTVRSGTNVSHTKAHL